MKKVVILGANGYMGKRLSLALANQGVEIMAYAHSMSSCREMEEQENITVIPFSLENIKELYTDARLSDADVLYNLAWIQFIQEMRNDVDSQVSNIAYGVEVMKIAKHHSIKKVVVPGSAAEIGCRDSIITGSETPAPSDMYSSSKAALHLVCDTYARNNDIDLIWTLITSVYGPGRNDNNIITYTIKSLLRGERPSFTKLEQQWDFLYIDDLVDALILLGEKGKGGKTYPVGSGSHNQMCEYVSMVRDKINPALELGIGERPYKNPNKIDNQIMDISELKEDTGFSPKFSFDEGIALTIDYFTHL